MPKWPKDSLSQEDVEDIVGAMVGYGLEYDDPQGIISKTREGPNPYDAAQTFAESDVTLTLNECEVQNGSIQLGTRPGTSKSWSEGDNTYSATGMFGMRMTPNVKIARLDIQQFPSSDATEARIDRVSDSTTVASKTISAGADVSFNVELQAGTKYEILLGGGGTRVPSTSDIHPSSYASFDIHGTEDNEYPYHHQIGAMAAYQYNKSDTAVIQWSQPENIYEWDMATFTQTLDGETVDVFVAYSDDGGSTWNRTNGGNPISRNYALSEDSNISPSDEVRIEVELSRANTANNPTLDSAYRSWRL